MSLTVNDTWCTPVIIVLKILVDSSFDGLSSMGRVDSEEKRARYLPRSRALRKPPKLAPDMRLDAARARATEVSRSSTELKSRERREGVLAVSSPSIMSGYRVPPPKSKQDQDNRFVRKTDAVKQGKWLTTGDVVSMSGDTTSVEIHFMGRREECMTLGDRYASLFAIDTLLKGYEGITESVTYPFHKEDGTVEIACSVVRHESSTINEGGIVAHLEKNVPAELIPKLYRFVDSISKDIGGNPMRYHLGNKPTDY